MRSRLWAIPIALGIVVVAALNAAGHDPSQVQALPDKAERVPTNALGRETRLSALYFDDRGADFTAWLNRFRDQTYRHWLLPEAAQQGAQGCAQFRVTVSRGGAIQRVHVTKPSRNKPLDRAAEAALRASTLLPLPSDYSAQKLTVDVAFFYNSEPVPQPRLCAPDDPVKE